MENEKRSMRPLSSQKLSNVDRELQRIKSLAVVSVLNKTFEDSTPIPLSSSSSSTTTTTTTSAINLEKSRARSASNSSNVSLGIKKKPSNTSLYHDVSKSTRRDLPPPLSGAIAETQAEVNITREQLVSSPVNSNEDLPHDTEKEKDLQKRLIELESLYELSLDKLKSTESRADAQTQLILMQDKLVHELSDQIEYLSDNSNHNHHNHHNNTSLTTTEEQGASSSSLSPASASAVSPPQQVSPEALLQAQEELVALKTEVLNFKPLKEEYEMLIVTLSRKLADSQARVEKMEKATLEMKKECAEQTLFIDTKVQVMLQQLQEKSKVIRRLEKEIEKRDSIEPMESVSVSSARSSLYSSNSQRKSFVAKWKGVSIPPAAPPPTLPLPPVPVAENSRPRSYVSIASSSNAPPHHLETVASYNMSIDAVGGAIQSQRRLSNFSEFETEMTDAEYYKEFTDQLQARLSISKEVDDLRLWEPSDFAEIQRKIDSNKWFDDEDEGGEQGQHHGKDQSAFWKGMKKKLRV